jgi:DNA-binding transcriptional MerR regulator
MEKDAKKLYYRIGEACRIVGVEPHVLRYWETEFPRLSPPKNKAGQRTYRPKDIEMLLAIRRLLYEEGFTIAGARKKLSGASASPPPGTDSPAGASRPAAEKPGQQLRQVRRELESILTLLDKE